MAMQQLQKTFPAALPLQSVASGNKRENHRDDPQQQWSKGHRQGVANK
jgi:hypothetical protein